MDDLTDYDDCMEYDDELVVPSAIYSDAAIGIGSEVVAPDESVSNIDTSSEASRNLRSEVWTHYDIDLITRKAKCKHCTKIYTYNPATTSNLLQHLRDKHSDKLGGVSKSKDKGNMSQPKINAAFVAPRVMYTDELFSDLLVDLFVSEDLAFSLIDSPKFIKLVQLLRPSAKLFSATTLKRKIMVKYRNEEEKFKKEMSLVTSKVSFTTDIWTSPAQIPFMAITAHWIDKNWVMRSQLLDFPALIGSHSGFNIYQTFKKVIDHCRLGPKMLGITCDNASNNDKFIELLVANYPSFKADHHFRCFAHVLNLAVQSALDIHSGSIASLRAAIRAVKVSPARRNQLQSLCQACEPKLDFLQPILDVPTRWNSTTDMLERAIYLQQPLSMFISQCHSLINSEDSYVLHEDDWVLFNELLSFLKNFREATTMASADKYPSLTSVVPLYNSLLDDAENAKKSHSSSETLKAAAGFCHEKLEKYYNKSSHACTVATVLDPRLRLHYYSETENGMDHVKSEEIFQIVNRIYLSNYAPTTNTPAAQVQIPGTLSRRIYKKVQLGAENELRVYCDSAPSDESVKPLAWWKENAATYPNLARMARDYLPIPGSSASSERAFSSARHMITDNRCSLSHETITACMSLKYWLKPRSSDFSTESTTLNLANDIDVCK